MIPTEEQRLAARDPGSRKPVMYQSWRHLLFLHWKVEPQQLQEKLPPGLTLDLFEGEAFVGIVPFFMCRVRPRWLPTFPGLSNFLELNVRTYVHDEDGVPGVWFFSLDANNLPAVWVARTFFHLPYRSAKMSAEVADDGWINYRSRCREGEYDGEWRYRGVGQACEAGRGTLEFFLLERYFLYAHDQKRGRLLRGQVAHAPYQYSPVEVARSEIAPLHAHGIKTRSQEFDHACYARDVPVRIFGLEKLGGG